MLAGYLLEIADMRAIGFTGALRIDQLARCTQRENLVL